jgi:hypothetical protein
MSLRLQHPRQKVCLAALELKLFAESKSDWEAYSYFLESTVEPARDARIPSNIMTCAPTQKNSTISADAVTPRIVDFCMRQSNREGHAADDRQAAHNVQHPKFQYLRRIIEAQNTVVGNHSLRRTQMPRDFL